MPVQPCAPSSTARRIAIIGMAGRFPGARNIEELWRNLCNGVDSLLPLREPDGAQERTRSLPLEGMDLFDPEFFGITSGEAALMCPEQRVLLECAQQSLERAGYGARKADETVAVFVAAGRSHYPCANTSADASSQAANTTAATRIAHLLDLKGPGLSLDAACSSSLVAVHQACRALVHEECVMALAGGVSSLHFGPDSHASEPEGMHSRFGYCRPFDDRADGTVVTCGVGVVLLKRLEDAERDRDPIVAVIRGSAINNDGAGKGGYTAPSVMGQARVITAAHRAAEVATTDIGFIETHGAGTRVGDSTEIAALTQAFAGMRQQERRCLLGAVKANVGNLGVAAGIAGLIKAALVVAKGVVPPTIHFREPNRDIDFNATPFRINSGLEEWRADAPRCAGVQSFGIGGTNAHVVLEGWPGSGSRELPGAAPHLLVLSARSKEALRGVCHELSAQLECDKELELADAAFTLQVGRFAHRWRKYVVAQSNADACERLRDQAPPGPCGVHSSDLVFMYPGQGTRYLGMAEPLYDTETFFRETFDRCAQIVLSVGGPDLHGVLLPRGERYAASRLLNRREVCEPALFVVEYAMSALLAHWGMRPSALIGYGLGEYVAACVSGVLDLEDALKLIVLRGRLLQRAPKTRMLAVDLSREKIELYAGAACSIAAVNGPASCLVSGPGAALSGLVRALERDGAPWRLLSGKDAFHAPLADTAAREFRSACEEVRFGPTRVPYVSNVTGTWITDALATSVDYWVRHLSHTVELWEGLRSLQSLPHKILVEVGPGTTLSSLARKAPLMSEVRIVSLNRVVRAGGARPMLDAIGQIWCAGGSVDWQAFNAGERHRRIPLPTYPFKRTRHWLESRAATHNPPVANITPNEAVVARIWRGLLGAEQVGPDDDFLDLGGDSLLLEQMARELESSCGRAVSVRDLMRHPTVAGMARLLDA